MLILVLTRDPNSWIHERRPGVAMALLCGAIVLPQLIGTEHLGDAIGRTDADLIPGFVAIGLTSAVAFQKQSQLARSWPGSIPPESRTSSSPWTRAEACGYGPTTTATCFRS
jgi:hypothetical protein